MSPDCSVFTRSTFNIIKKKSRRVGKEWNATLSTAVKQRILQLLKLFLKCRFKSYDKGRHKATHIIFPRKNKAMELEACFEMEMDEWMSGVVEQWRTQWRWRALWQHWMLEASSSENAIFRHLGVFAKFPTTCSIQFTGKDPQMQAGPDTVLHFSLFSFLQNIFQLS